MSRVKVNEITNKVATGPVDFPDGITGVALTVTGNVTVGGTIISEDTTNVDSVGWVTARSGLNVGPPSTGIGATIQSVGDAVFAGVCTATSFSGSGANLTGITALTGSTDNTLVTVTGANAIQGEAKLTFDGDTLKFTHDAVTNFDSNAQDFLVIENGDSDTYINIASETNRDSGVIFSDDTRARGWYGYNHSGDYSYMGTAGSERLRIGSSGQLGIGGATYGSSGQVLTSGGASAAPSWATPTSSLSDQSVQAEQVTDQTMGTNAWNLVKFNAQNWDTGNNYDHNNGNWYYQAPSNGKYWYKASAKLIDLAADKEFDIALYKSTDNGGSYTIQKKSQRWVFTRENTASVVIIETTGLMALNEDDRIRVYVWHNHGSNRDLDDNFCLFEVFRLGD